jgi:hypothetical protein
MKSEKKFPIDSEEKAPQKSDPGNDAGPARPLHRRRAAKPKAVAAPKRDTATRTPANKKKLGNRKPPTEEIDRVADELQRHIFDLIVPLQNARIIDARAFDAAEEAARKLARLLKGNALLPRKSLHVLDMATQSLEAAALFAKDSAFVQQMAQTLKGTLTLIIWGECHEDYKGPSGRFR